MNKHYKDTMTKQSKKLSIVLVGSMGQEKAFEEAIKQNNLDHKIEFKYISQIEDNASLNPDIVILDRFPESDLAKSAYYHFRQQHNVSFIGLNETPTALKFLHLNALSFLKMIRRNQNPATVICESVALANSKLRLSGASPEYCLDEKSKGKMHNSFYQLPCETCC
ncbi:MAG: hypothetical protein GY729_13495 [Desulfobacteraceae bacterium]|nr:hypothetical protein [Desulfobacteraceae bacterium]